MRNFNDISFKEFAKTLLNIEIIRSKNKTFLNKMLHDICRECRIADEMLYYIKEMHDKGIVTSSVLATEHYKVILAMWVLINNYQCSDITIH